MNFKTLLSAIAGLLISAGAIAQNVPGSQLEHKQTPITNGFSYINKLVPVSYEYNVNKYSSLNLPSGLQYGFEIKEVEQSFPQLITNEAKWYFTGKNEQHTVVITTVDMQKLVPILVSTLQEQQAEIELLKTEISKMKSSYLNKNHK